MAARLIVACLIAAASLAPAIRAQSPASPARVTFEVATVKPHVAGDLNSSMDAKPGGVLVATNQTLRNLIRTAYRIQRTQIEGGPAWLDIDRFDITASACG